MEVPNPDCDSCQFLHTRVALLQAEAAARETMIAELAQPPSLGEPLLTIRNADAPAQLIVFSQQGEGDDAVHPVTVIDCHMQATTAVGGVDLHALAQLISGLAAENEGWEGARSFASRDGDLIIDWEYDGSMYRPEVWARVRLQNDWHEPRWTVSLHLQLWPETLSTLADALTRTLPIPSRLNQDTWSKDGRI